MKKYRVLQPNKGFSLIEMMIVISIISMLALFVGQKVMKSYEQARVSLTEAQIDSLCKSLELYLTNHSSYPSTQQGLEALVEAGYIDEVPQDRWNNDFIYEADPEGETYEIKSIHKGRVISSKNLKKGKNKTHQAPSS